MLYTLVLRIDFSNHTRVTKHGPDSYTSYSFLELNFLCQSKLYQTLWHVSLNIQENYCQYTDEGLMVPCTLKICRYFLTKKAKVQWQVLYLGGNFQAKQHYFPENNMSVFPNEEDTVSDIFPCFVRLSTYINTVLHFHSPGKENNLLALHVPITIIKNN